MTPYIPYLIQGFNNKRGERRWKSVVKGKEVGGPYKKILDAWLDLLNNGYIEEVMQTEAEKKKPDLQVIEGGKDPQPAPKLAGREPPWEDWLSKQKVGTILLIQNKMDYNGYGLQELTVINVTEANNYLLEFSGGTGERRMWVKPLEFCKDWKLMEILRRF